jgi:hypothetical protein
MLREHDKIRSQDNKIENLIKLAFKRQHKFITLHPIIFIDKHDSIC